MNNVEKLQIPIVIVTYNPSHDFFEQYTRMMGYQFIIVDNSEVVNNNLFKQIASFNNVIIIHNYQNVGIAKALNIGCQCACDLGYKYVVTMDQDSILTENIISGLKSFIAQREDNATIAIVSPLHIMQHGVKNRVNLLDDITYGINTMTSGNLLNLSIWQKISGFTESLFIDMVDVDYYCRAMIAGYKVITLNQVTMQHSLGDMQVINFGKFKLKVFNHSQLRKYYQIRNSLYILKNYSCYDFGVKGLLLRFLFHACIGVLFEQFKINKMKMIVLGFIDFCKNKYGKYE